MPSIYELVRDNIPEIVRAIDITLFTQGETGEYRIGMPDPALDPYYLRTFYQSPRLAWAKIKEFVPTLGYHRAMDQEVLMDRETAQVTIDEMGAFAIAKGHIFGEEDRQIWKELEMHLSSKGPGSAAAVNALEAVFTTRPLLLANGVLNTHRRLAQQVGNKGVADHYFPKTKTTIEIDYTSQMSPGLAAATLTGADRWSQVATADGIADLVAHLGVYFDFNTSYPAGIEFPGELMDNLRNQLNTKRRVARKKGTVTDALEIVDAAAANLPLPTVEEVRMTMVGELKSAGFMLGDNIEFIVTEAKYFEKDEAGSTTQGTYHEPGYYNFVSPGFVETALVPSYSSDLLQGEEGAGFTNGLTIYTKQENDIPAKQWVKVDSNGIIIVPDARKLGFRNCEGGA